MPAVLQSEKEKKHVRLLNGVASPPPPPRKSGNPITPGNAIGMPLSQKREKRTEGPMAARGATRNTLHEHRGWAPSLSTLASSSARQIQRPSPKQEGKPAFAPLREMWKAPAPTLDGQETIVIDDDEEVVKDDAGLHQIKMATIDPMHQRSPPPWDRELQPDRSPRNYPPNLPDFTSPFLTESNCEDFSSTPTSDGGAQRMHESHPPSDTRLEGIETDPIEPFSDDDMELAESHDIPSQAAPPYRVVQASLAPASVGFVHERVQTLEMARNSNQPSAVPHLNLRAVGRKTIADRMQGAHGSIAISTTHYTHGKAGKRKSAVSQSGAATSGGSYRFPIDSAFLGPVLIDNLGDSDEQRWLNINPNDKDGTLCIAVGAVIPRSPDKLDLSIKLWELSDWEICEESAAYMIACQFRPGSRSLITGPAVNVPEDDPCAITIRFSNHASMNNFKEFASAIRKAVKSVRTVGAAGAKARWQMAQNNSMVPNSSPTPTPSRSGSAVKKPRLTDLPENDTRKPAVARRSARVSQLVPPRMPTPEPQPPDDEVILVHAPLGGGSFHITYGDRKRLQPSEFLNDTLIEFGLKLWIDDLRAQNPRLADQIHVFNSFFYNKLSAPRKKVPETYANVRKWTAKFDLFNKKYLVVPINENVHWYLAIICQPELVLQPPRLPAEKPTSPSVQTRERKRQEERDTLDSVDSIMNEGTAMTGLDDLDGKEVEGMLNMDSHTQESEPTGTNAPSGIDSDVEPLILPATPEVPQEPVTARLSGSPLSDIDSSPIPTVVPVKGNQDFMIPTPAAPSNFYARQELRGEDITFSSMNPDTDVIMEDGTSATSPTSPTDVPSRQDTVIFTLDSLGGRHPRVWKTLGEYLQHEARDKKNMPLETTSIARGVQAHVPTQPNFCDCGLYLLHFVKQFFTDPEDFQSALLMTPQSGKAQTDRKARWLDKDVGSLREAYAAKIDSLADAWRASQHEKLQPTTTKNKLGSAGEGFSSKAPEENIAAVDDSDDDVVITGETPAPVKTRGGLKPRPKRKIASDIDISEGSHVGNAERIR